MALYYVLGDILVDQDEVVERARHEDRDLAPFAAFAEAVRVGGHVDVPPIPFATGDVTFEKFVATARFDAETPFQPVGLGKPATIMLRHVYTGRNGNADMLLTSAVRDPIATFNQAPRATNLMPKRVRKRSHIQGPAATDSGTELVYYINALTSQSLALTFDLAFDDFPDELVDRVGSAITTAGGIPVFGPYSGVLLAVGQAIKLIGRLANALVDARPEFSVTDRQEFEIPGSPIPTSGYKVLTTPRLNPDDFRFELDRGLVQKDTGRQYDGDEPYIVYLLDGTQNDSLKGFTPTAASAALLAKFMNLKEGAEVVIDSITEAIKLFSDMQYRREADRLQEAIARLPEGSEERKKLEARRAAAIANILEKLLKPADG